MNQILGVEVSVEAAPGINVSWSVETGELMVLKINGSSAAIFFLRANGTLYCDYRTVSGYVVIKSDGAVCDLATQGCVVAPNNLIRILSEEEHFVVDVNASRDV